MTKLELPPTIRIARLDELPSTFDPEIIEKNKTAKIIEGHTFKLNDDNNLPFNFFCEINIDNSRLWSLFRALMFSYTEEVSFIFGHIDHEPNYSKYLDKLEILNLVNKYEVEFTQDGFLEFGTIYHDEKKLKEVFIKKQKYIQFWGIDEIEFKEIMNRFSIFQIDDLQFIDEFPLVTEALGRHQSEVVKTGDLIRQLQSDFDKK